MICKCCTEMALSFVTGILETGAARLDVLSVSRPPRWGAAVLPGVTSELMA